MIIWRGLGFLVPVIAVAVFITVQLVTDVAFGDNYYSATAWPKYLSGSIIGVAMWPLGTSLNHRPDRILIDPETDEEVVVGGHSHSLFFVPVQWWGPIIFVLMAVNLLGLLS